MLKMLDRDDFKGFAANIVGALSVVLVINSVVFRYGLTRHSESVNPWFAPPSAVIAAAWFLLFMLNGAARWSLNGNADDTSRRLKGYVTAVFLINATHPIYTAGFSLYVNAFLGTIVALALTLYVMARAWSIRPTTSLLMIPMAAWLCFAMAIIAVALGWVGGG